MFNFFLLFLFLEILECMSSPCGANGICMEQIDGYFCDCAVGFQGVHCDKGESDRATDLEIRNASFQEIFAELCIYFQPIIGCFCPNLPAFPGLFSSFRIL